MLVEISSAGRRRACKFAPWVNCRLDRAPRYQGNKKSEPVNLQDAPVSLAVRESHAMKIYYYITVRLSRLKNYLFHTLIFIIYNFCSLIIKLIGEMYFFSRAVQRMSECKIGTTNKFFLFLHRSDQLSLTAGTTRIV